ncbi:MAG TPA: hypothetical protein DEO33_03735 [Rikenellaceae bacterium]|nr:hypothetical protein [Rikenellaceae bacterium]
MSMKMKPSRDRYDKLSEAKRKKEAVEWCTQILSADIDGMSERALMKLFYGYHYLVAYPAPLGYVLFPDNSAENTDEEHVRETLKDYQEKAKDLIDDFKDMQNKPGRSITLDAAMAFKVKVGTNGVYSVSDNTDQDFIYSYARQIAKLLDGKRFDDVIKICPVCSHHFAVTTKHDRQSCSHKCAMGRSSKKRFEKNPDLELRRRNLHSFVSRYRKQGRTDKEIRPILRKYLKDRKIKQDELPQYIRKIVESHY